MSEDPKVILKTKDYTLSENENQDWPYFLTDEEGAGFSLSDHDMNEMLDRHYIENM